MLGTFCYNAQKVFPVYFVLRVSKTPSAGGYWKKQRKMTLINIEQNEIVKIFSVAAVIFMPATLIASIYGMNFKFMPELDWTLTLGNGWNIPLGYIFAIGLMIFCSALTIWYFKYKKWL